MKRPLIQQSDNQTQNQGNKTNRSTELLNYSSGYNNALRRLLGAPSLLTNRDALTLQRTLGNQNLKRLILEQTTDSGYAARANGKLIFRKSDRKAKPNASTLDFTDEPEELRRLSGNDPEIEISDIHSLIHQEIGFFFDNWLTGLADFVTNMAFASAQEAEANYVGVLGASIAKSVFDVMVDEIPTSGPAGLIAKLVLTTVVNAGIDLYEENERTNKASGELDLKQYINSLRDHIEESRKSALRNHSDSKPSVLEDYRKVASSSPTPTEVKNSGAWVYGDAARWISQYRQVVSILRSRMPTNKSFQQLITERFAFNGTYVGLVNQGTWRPSGTLSLSVAILREKLDDGWHWRVEEIDDHWTLGTTAAKEDRVAENLMDSLQKQGPVLTHCNLPKQIHIVIETEVPGLNEETAGTLYIAADQSARIEFKGDAKLFRAFATSPSLKEHILAVTKIRGERS